MLYAAKQKAVTYMTVYVHLTIKWQWQRFSCSHCILQLCLGLHVTICPEYDSASSISQQVSEYPGSVMPECWPRTGQEGLRVTPTERDPFSRHIWSHSPSQQCASRLSERQQTVTTTQQYRKIQELTSVNFTSLLLWVWLQKQEEPEALISTWTLGLDPTTSEVSWVQPNSGPDRVLSRW